MQDDVAFPVSADRLLGGRLTLQQPEDGYRAAIDPVLLAAAVPALGTERVADLGCGVGTSGLCLAMRVPSVAVLGLDLQADLITLARRNAHANSLADRVTFTRGDVLDFAETGFDHVLVNPPYLARDTASISPNPIKAIANVEGNARLADWVACATVAAKTGGTVSFIHRFDRAEALRQAMAQGLGDLRLLPLLPRQGVAPKRIILQGTKGAPAAFTTLEPWILHDADGRFTPQTEGILRDAAVLPLTGHRQGR